MATKELSTQETQQEVSKIGAALRDLIEAVPQSSIDDAQYRIVMQILEAKDFTELDNPWGQTAGLGEYNDQNIVIHSIVRAPSTFQGGPGIFLILDVETADGERHVVTTGSVSVVVQLLKAYEFDAFPLSCMPQVSKRQTSRGYWPQHLKITQPDTA